MEGVAIAPFVGESEYEIMGFFGGDDALFVLFPDRSDLVDIGFLALELRREKHADGFPSNTLDFARKQVEFLGDDAVGFRKGGVEAADTEVGAASGSALAKILADLWAVAGKGLP